jgi:hypothetical protein
MNLKLGGIAAAAGFSLSLLIGVAFGGELGVSLLRAAFFGIIFFVLALMIWRFINRFLPELLALPGEESLMAGLETGTRVDIFVGDEELPVNAAIPPEDAFQGELGNVEDLLAKGPPVRPASAPLPGTAAPGAPGGYPVLDLGAKEGYSESGAAGVPVEKKQGEAPAASVPAEKSGAVFVPAPPPQIFSGGDSGGSVESLPDLDAMAGAFMSSGEEGAEETAASASIFGVEPSLPAAGKTKGRKDDYNPKEVASAIQTILKRD